MRHNLLSNITKLFCYHNDEQKHDYGMYKIGQEVEAGFDRNQKARAIKGGIEGVYTVCTASGLVCI